MVRLLIVFIFLILFGDFALTKAGVPLLGKLVPEAISGLLLIVVAVQLALHRRLDLPPKYLLWIGLFTVVITMGVVLNNVSTGAVFMGLREHFKYAPIFLLPIVYHFSQKQLSTLFYCILFFAVLQFPLMGYQRLAEIWATGDNVRGTFATSNHVSIFLISCWAILFSFMLRKRVSVKQFGVLSFILLVPTMLNETKGSLVLLPVALLVPMLVTGDIKNLFRKLMLGGVSFVTLAVIYSKVGDIWHGSRAGLSMLDFFTNPERLIYYLTPSASGGTWMGRLDKLFFAWDQISGSFATIMIGLGIGNVNETSSVIFEGEFSAYGGLVGTGLNQFLWETGILGTLLAFVVPLMSFRDAKKVAKGQGFSAAMAVGWCAICPILFLSMMYIRPPDAQAISFLFWFFTGVIAANAYRLRIEQMAPQVSMDGDVNRFKVISRPQTLRSSGPQLISKRPLINS